jgi:hypothetical protein
LPTTIGYPPALMLFNVFIVFVVFIELSSANSIQLSDMSLFHQPNEPKKPNKRNERYFPPTLISIPFALFILNCPPPGKSRNLFGPQGHIADGGTDAFDTDLYQYPGQGQEPCS